MRPRGAGIAVPVGAVGSEVGTGCAGARGIVVAAGFTPEVRGAPGETPFRRTQAL